MNKIMMTVLLVPTLFVSACGSDSGGTAGVKTTELEGIWVGVCQQTGSDTSGNDTLTFTDNTYTRTNTIYSDATCTVADLSQPSFSQSGTFVLGGSVTTSSGKVAKKIDVTTQQPINSQNYDIVSINNGRLYLGLGTIEKDYSSPENRPVALDLVEYFVNKTAPVSVTAELAGTWNGACESDSFFPDMYGRITLTFSADTFTGATGYYSDAACTVTDNRLSPVTYSGIFTVWNPLTTTSGQSAREIDLTILEAFGQPVNLVFYEIYGINSGNLYFGSNVFSTGEVSVENRPADLDLTQYLTFGDSPVTTTWDLEGVWVSKCDLLGGGDYYNVTMTITGSTFNFDGKQYSDSACTGAGSTFYTSSGTFVIGDSLITSSGWDAKQLDVTTLKENGANVNVKVYDIYSIDNMRWYLGNDIDGKDGTTATNRPIDLNFEWYYDKS